MCDGAQVGTMDAELGGGNSHMHSHWQLGTGCISGDAEGKPPGQHGWMPLVGDVREASIGVLTAPNLRLEVAPDSPQMTRYRKYL